MTRSTEAERERLLDEVVASYLKALDAGRMPDRQRLLESFPELASELRAFFDDQDRLVQLGVPPRPASKCELSAAPSSLPETGPVFLDPVRATRPKIVPGILLAGRYRIFAVKAGGMGQVYLAEDLHFGQEAVAPKFAIKTVADYEEWQEARWAKGAAADEVQYAALLTRFRREALAWVRLGKHDNIIFAWWVADIGAKPHLIMEYADSGDLRTWIKEGRLTLPLAVNFAIQFCQGMIHAVKTSGMVHRDIKPANVLVKNDRILKIADFGLAKAFDPQPEDARLAKSPELDDAMSLAGGGTLPYMAPEQFASLSRADTRSDVFSFGAMLFEMLTSRPLFRARNAAEHYALRRTSPSPAHEVNPQVPAALSAIITRCVAVDPHQRYPSFAALAVELNNVSERLAGHMPIPRDADAIPAEKFTPSLQILGESYSLISLGQFEEAA